MLNENSFSGAQSKVSPKFRAYFMPNGEICYVQKLNCVVVRVQSSDLKYGIKSELKKNSMKNWICILKNNNYYAFLN